jgi:hypothetical protein
MRLRIPAIALDWRLLVPFQLDLLASLVGRLLFSLPLWLSNLANKPRAFPVGGNAFLDLSSCLQQTTADKEEAGFIIGYATTSDAAVLNKLRSKHWAAPLQEPSLNLQGTAQRSQ